MVGSVIAKVVLLTSAVAPSKTKGEAPTMLPEERVRFPFATKFPFAVNACCAFIGPFTVVVVPLLAIATAVALVMPKLSAAPESIESAPAVVPQFEAAPPVSVRLPAEVNDEAPVGVRLTDPAPVALKFPAASVKRIAFPLEVVIVPPLL